MLFSSYFDNHDRSSVEQKFCRFCCDTKELSIVYKGHNSYFLDGKALCPKMRAQGCSNCGQKGDFAHNADDCPESIKSAEKTPIKMQAKKLDKQQKTRIAPSGQITKVPKKSKASKLERIVKVVINKAKKKKIQPLRVRLLNKLLKESLFKKRGRILV